MVDSACNITGPAVDPAVDEETIAAFGRDGAVCLRKAFSRDWIDELAAGVEVNFASPSEDGCRYTPEDAPGGFYDDYCNWQRIGQFRHFVLESPAAGIAAALMRSETARIFHEHVLVKEPGTREPTPWHHDQPYYCVDGDQLCSIWLPLDPVPRAAAIEFVAGSHRWGKLFMPRKFKDESDYGKQRHEGFDPLPDIDRHPERYERIGWELEVGDCVVFHMRTLHGAAGTERLETRRRAFSTRWLGDDARFARRPFETSPPFRGLKLEAGDPMDHPLFPQVWPRAAAA